MVLIFGQMYLGVSIFGLDFKEFHFGAALVQTFSNKEFFKLKAFQ